MFAVKGWSVDPTALKPQVDPAADKKERERERAKKSKKRKRALGSDANNPNTQALGNKRPRSEDQAQSEKRAQKLDEETREERKKRKLDKKAKKEESGQRNELSKLDDGTAGPELERWEDIVPDHKAEKAAKKSKRSREKTGASIPDVKTTQVSDDVEDETAEKKLQSANTKTITAPEPSKLTPMQSAMRQKLISARFRHLNETLYTEPSAKAQELFDRNPDMFQDYHAGFRQQVSVWPENPLDKFILAIRKRGKIKAPVQFKAYRKKVNSKVIRPAKDDGSALPRSSGTSVIADLGCGDARLAHTLTDSGDTKKLNLKVLSFDLHSPSSHVTKADISNLPTKDESVDVAILCLALMGTNWISFIEEAHRILHWKGELWVAEIKSRFGRVGKSGKPLQHSVGAQRKQPPTKASEAKAKEEAVMEEEEALKVVVDGVATTQEETDVSTFVQVLKRRGFILKPPSEKSVDLRNKMFVKMEFVKALTPIKGKRRPDRNDKIASSQKLKFFADGEEDIDTDEESKVLKPCLYKTR